MAPRSGWVRNREAVDARSYSDVVLHDSLVFSIMRVHWYFVETMPHKAGGMVSNGPMCTHGCRTMHG